MPRAKRLHRGLKGVKNVMTQSCYAIYGANGYGREVMPLLKESVKTGSSVVFVDDSLHGIEVSNCNVLSYDDFSKLDVKNKFINVAISNSKVREKLVNSCLYDGFELFTLTASNVVIMDNVTLGEGSILCPFVTLTSDIVIGQSFHANIYSYVAHDCVIGDYVTFAPGVMCNGNVVVEDHAYIGTGAIIKQGLPGKPIVIGKGATVGMGAVVTKSVDAGITVVGNPAKPFVK